MKLDHLATQSEIIGNKVKEITPLVTGTKQQAKLTAILVQLYSDPYIFVQELVSNAVDSHIEAGKPTANVHLHLDDNVFTVTDFGVGIDDERAKLTYSFLHSTKEDSNDYIGGYGLGAKSPLSYCTSFTVSSVKDGMFRVYDISIKEGVLTPVKIVEGKSDKSNQTTVSIPVKSEHLQGIYDAVKFKTLYVDNVIYEGKLESINDTKVFKVHEDLYLSDVGESDHIIIGNVPYRLDRDKLYNYDFSPSYINQDKWCYGVKFDIGDIIPLPTREDIQYSNENIDIIQKKLGKVYSAFRDYIQQNYSNEIEPKTLYDLYKNYSAPFKMGSVSIPTNFFNKELYYRRPTEWQSINYASYTKYLKVRANVDSKLVEPKYMEYTGESGCYVMDLPRGNRNSTSRLGQNDRLLYNEAVPGSTEHKVLDKILSQYPTYSSLYNKNLTLVSNKPFVSIKKSRKKSGDRIRVKEMSGSYSVVDTTDIPKYRVFVILPSVERSNNLLLFIANFSVFRFIVPYKRSIERLEKAGVKTITLKEFFDLPGIRRRTYKVFDKVKCTNAIRDIGVQRLSGCIQYKYCRKFEKYLPTRESWGAINTRFKEVFCYTQKKGTVGWYVDEILKNSPDYYAKYKKFDIIVQTKTTDPHIVKIQFKRLLELCKS